MPKNPPIYMFLFYIYIDVAINEWINNIYKYIHTFVLFVFILTAKESWMFVVSRKWDYLHRTKAIPIYLLMILMRESEGTGSTSASWKED